MQSFFSLGFFSLRDDGDGRVGREKDFNFVCATTSSVF